MEKLKVQEAILFYDELTLYEDELADNGCSLLSLKFRCMPSGFFILLRLYLRVDRVLVRINDTRIHWETANRYLLREYSSKERRIEELTVKQREIVTDANAISQYLNTVNENFEKLEF